MEHLTIFSEPQPNANIKWYIEVEYLKNIFIEKNHSETLGWYNTMVAALPPDDYLTDLAQRYYDGCMERGPTSLLDANSNRTEVLKLLTEAIRIAPAHSVLADCFQLRATDYDFQLFIGAIIMRHAAQIKLKVCLLTPNGELSNDNARTSDSVDADNWCLTEEHSLNETQANRIRSKFKSFLEKVSEYAADVMTGSVSPDDDYKSNIDQTRELFECCLAKASTAHAVEAAQKRAAFQLYVEEMYKRHFFHHNYGADFNRPQKMRCIYPTLSMVEHSCDPNCAIV